jgi:hypothetical protein
MTAHQVALFGDDDPSARRAVGPVEHHTRRAVQAAQLDPELAGAAAVLCDVAWAIDAARAAGKFYGVAQAAPPYTDLARALGLTVDGRKEGGTGGTDPDAWLRQLTDPTLGNTPQP